MRGSELALAAATLAALAAAAAAQAAPANSTGLEGPPLVVCLTAIEPFVFCDPNRPSATYSGFDVELWRRIAGPGVAVSDAFRDRGYEFRCLDSLAALLAGAAPGGGCDLAMGSITMTEERIAAGSRYSFPYYLSALGVLVKSEPATASGWGWVRPFSWQLWAALGATLLVYPLILALIEFGSLKTRVRARELGPGYFEAIIRSMWTLTGGETLEVSSAGAKLASVCFAFTALILAATYTANLASELTVSSLTSSISSVEALRGRAVLTDTIYAPRLLAHHGIAALEAPLSSAAAGRAAAEQVLSGSLAAVVNDFPYLLRASASQPGCVLRVLPWRIEEFNYAIVVSADFPEELLQKLDVAILTLQENNELEVLKERFNVLGDLCADAATETQAVQLQSLAGLWVVLLGGAAAGAVLMTVNRCRRRRLLASEAADSVIAGDADGGELGRAFSRSKSSALESSTALSGHEIGFKDRLDTVVERG